MSDSKSDTKAAYVSSHNAAVGEPGGSIFGHIWAAICATVILGIICCGFYPVAVLAIGQTVFRYQANGSLVKKDGTPTTNDQEAVGSALIGQSFTAPGYFHSRISAAGNGYDASSSGGSNLGPLSAKLLHGTTKNSAITVFAFDKSHPPAPVSGRIEGVVAAVTGTTITITPTGATKKVTYTLDATVADPNMVVNSRGRTIHATTLAASTNAGSNVELKFDGKTPPKVTAISVIDQELDSPPAAVDTNANKITLPDASSTVINFDPKNTAFIVNGKTDAKPGDITADMSIHAVVSVVMDYDGIADRVIHYCEDNNIAYKSSIPVADFKDADGIDDSRLNQEMNNAPDATITPAVLIPGDAVTASGSGLDPHISPRNAELQTARVAAARGIKPDQVQKLIDDHTDGRSLGLFGDPGVNVLMLNLALDAKYPVPPPAAQPVKAP